MTVTTRKKRKTLEDQDSNPNSKKQNLDNKHDKSAPNTEENENSESDSSADSSDIAENDESSIIKQVTNIHGETFQFDSESDQINESVTNLSLVFQDNPPEIESFPEVFEQKPEEKTLIDINSESDKNDTGLADTPTSQDTIQQKPYGKDTFSDTSFTDHLLITPPEQFLNVSGVEHESQQKHMMDLKIHELEISSQQISKLESENASLKLKNELLLRMACDGAKNKIKRFDDMMAELKNE